MKQNELKNVNVVLGRVYDETMKTAKPIDAIMRKENAIDILKGIKRNEFRDFTDFWVSRLCTYEKNEVTGIKPFRLIHFHNYNNSWFLDCKVGAINICKDDEAFARAFGDECATVGDGSLTFVICLGEVVATNLQID